MILQPLFENAVKHGVYESTEQVRIHTTASLRDKLLHLEITNNYDPEAIPRKGTGLGLRNIRERLRLIYQNETLLKTTSENNLFKVSLTIPQEPVKN
jgi:LytS/YehU family sensor histidine kinase